MNLLPPTPTAGLDAPQRQRSADAVFQALHRDILTLQLLPGARLSETEVAEAMGVSRQPVRDAFYRLSTIGLLIIRPQRFTQVSLISEDEVMRARFVREALERAVVREACARFSGGDLALIEANLASQQQAVTARQAGAFHELDDQFHRLLCDLSGHAHVWAIIRDHKAHMDRVRFLSLSFALEEAFAGHRTVFEAIRRQDAEAASAAMGSHLARIKEQIKRIRQENIALFEPLAIS